MKYHFALDLKNDPILIREYEDYHKKIWPEIEKSIFDAGVRTMEIYRVENRLFLLMEVEDTFSLERKADMDATNPKVQEWEKLMWHYQQAIPGSQPNEKWRLMKRIFKLAKDNTN